MEGIHPGLTPDALTEAARIASSDLEMGLWLHRALGAMAELDRWNAALESLGGDYRPIANGKSLREELEEYRRDLRVPLRALARALAVDGTDYECLHDELERVKLPDALEAVRWTLSFRDAVSIVLGPLESRIVRDLAVALRDASETTGFVSVLQRSGLGVDPLIDPAQVHGENDRLCARLIDDVARTAIVWCGRVQLSAGGWADVESLKGSVAARVRSGQGFLQRFDEPKAFAEVRAGVPRGTSLVADGPYAPLWQALDAAASVAELLVGLGLATGDLEGASEILLRQEEVARRKKRLLPIAGGEFDTAAENLGALFDHIRNGSAIPEALDMMAVSQLASVAARRRDSPSGRGGTPPRGRGRRYASQELKNAIALAGEIRAYRWLLATYGPAVGPDCWLSSLGVHAFPANTSDDGAGCDFRLKIPDSKFTLHLEVKATPGEEEAFELGSSEIELAREVLSSRRRKKDLFRILHVLDVFSPTPTPVLLPNPYDPNQRVFRIDEGGVRMRYRRAQPAPGTVEPT